MESSKRILGLSKKKTADIAGGESSTSTPGDPARSAVAYHKDLQSTADADTDEAVNAVVRSVDGPGRSQKP